MQNQLIKRDIVDRVFEVMEAEEILVLHGARQVGKSSIMFFVQQKLQSQAKLTHYLDLEDSRNLGILNNGAEALVAYLEEIGFNLRQIQENQQKMYVFIDEIQYLDNPSNFLKLIADHHKYLKLIVSGSSSFAIKSKFRDSLVGRTIEFVVYNLSFREFLRFKNVQIKTDNLTTPQLIDDVKKYYHEYIQFGGYPKITLTNDKKLKETRLQQIIDTYVKRDILDFSQIGNLTKFHNLLKLLAMQSGQLLNISALASICNLSRQTVENYLFLLENTYIIKLLSPFSKSPTVEISKAPKVFFLDTGLMQMLRSKALIKDLSGNNFETSVFCELMKKYGADTLHFWRTKSGNEIDFILDQGQAVLPLEVKLNFNLFRRGSMQEFLRKYDIENYNVVGLEGEKVENGLYPWEI